MAMERYIHVELNVTPLCEDVTPFSPSFWQIPRENIYKQVQQRYVKKRMVTETEKYIKL